MHAVHKHANTSVFTHPYTYTHSQTYILKSTQIHFRTYLHTKADGDTYIHIYRTHTHMQIKDGGNQDTFCNVQLFSFTYKLKSFPSSRFIVVLPWPGKKKGLTITAEQTRSTNLNSHRLSYLKEEDVISHYENLFSGACSIAFNTLQPYPCCHPMGT